MAQMAAPDEIVVAGDNRLRVAQDMLDLRALLALVKSSVAWWEQRLNTAEGVNRERAAAAISELSRIFDSLAQQLAQGRETMRITTRLPTTRIYTIGCPVCGSGNRSSARFCLSCGSSLSDPEAKKPAIPDKQILRVRYAARSDQGQVRGHNEDTCKAETLVSSGGQTATMLLVADGMGGMQAGERASRLASEAAHHMLSTRAPQPQPTNDEDWHDVLRQAVLAANKRIYDQAQSTPAYSGMGTTLTLLVIAGSRAHLAHVGDSRTYLFNANGVTEDGAKSMQMTSDHSLVARLVDIGQLTPEEARVHPQRNVIYRALGHHPTVEVDTFSQPISPGDRLLLCSDGLTVHLDDATLERMVLAYNQPEHICQRLIDHANALGGLDNISVVLAVVAGVGE
jgi:protein phosphatase